MDRIRKREFTGNALVFWLLCLSGIGIPLAILYLVNGTIETEFDVDDAEGFWESYAKQKKWWHFY